MTHHIERTPAAQQDFDAKIAGEPAIRIDTDGATHISDLIAHPLIEPSWITDPISTEGSVLTKEQFMGAAKVTVSDSADYDMFRDDTPIEPQCDLENPESCESCQ